MFVLLLFILTLLLFGWYWFDMVSREKDFRRTMSWKHAKSVLWWKEYISTIVLDDTERIEDITGFTVKELHETPEDELRKLAVIKYYEMHGFKIPKTLREIIC